MRRFWWLTNIQIIQINNIVFRSLRFNAAASINLFCSFFTGTLWMFYEWWDQWSQPHPFMFDFYSSILYIIRRVLRDLYFVSIFCWQAFVHISTFYSNCDRDYIAEKVYEPEFGYEKIIEVYSCLLFATCPLAEKQQHQTRGIQKTHFSCHLFCKHEFLMQVTRIFNDASLEKIEHCLKQNMPNTYTFTKKCSENLVNHRAHLLPAGIFRPPISTNYLYMHLNSMNDVIDDGF